VVAFWCLEHELEVLPGRVECSQWYSGGQRQPTLSPGGPRLDTGHLRAWQVRFENARPDQAIHLLRAFLAQRSDPLDGGAVLWTRGAPTARRSSHSGNTSAGAGPSPPAGRRAGNWIQKAAADIGCRISDQLSKVLASRETYHRTSPAITSFKYNYYRWSCGRDQRLNQIWGSKARTSRAMA